MAALNALPIDVVRQIVEYLSPDPIELRKCSFICHKFWHVASSALYRHIDLTIDENSALEAWWDSDFCKAANERRQLLLLQSLARNPILGAMVRSFRNHIPEDKRISDATFDDNTSVIFKAAANLIHLRTASLTANPLSFQIIINLQSYSQLTYLHVRGLQPEAVIWEMAPVSLKSLKWETPIVSSTLDFEQNAWDIAQFVLTVVEATCPDLESLEISVATVKHLQAPPILPVIPPERSGQYRLMKPSPSNKLPRLRHFGFDFGSSCATALDLVKARFLNFVERYKLSLRSLCMPFHSALPVREQLLFIVKVCELLPNLANLSLAPIEDEQKEQESYGFYNALTTALASPTFSIERFCLLDHGGPFSPAIGNLFTPWNSLKILRLGDSAENRYPFYNNNPHMGPDYTAAILDFIKALPQSLEELYIEMYNAEDYCYVHSDFDPICDLERDIFSALRRLHTCDIHAWGVYRDHIRKDLPDKGVFFRRLTHQPTTAGNCFPANNKIKDLWTARIDSFSEGWVPETFVECVRWELEDDEGVFEGRDAERLWCYGFESAHLYDQTHSLRRQRTWPFGQKTLDSYSMFRAKDICCWTEPIKKSTIRVRDTVTGGKGR